MSKSLSVRIMEHIKTHPTAGNREIAEAVGCTHSQARGSISAQYVRGYIKRTDHAGNCNVYSRRLAVTELGESVINGARMYSPGTRARNSKPPEKKGEPIRRKCLKCRTPFESTDRRKEWVCKSCKSTLEWKAA